MKILLNKNLFEEALNDLDRKHPFAFERVGYLLGNLEDKKIVLDKWLSIKDDFYEESNGIGARIGRDGMIFLMKKAFQSKKTLFSHSFT